MAETTFIEDELLGTSTATEAQYNEQIAALLSEGLGTTIPVGTLSPIAGSNRLSWGEIKRRAELGLPINEGEFLPNIPSMPDGTPINAQTFYNLTGIPATTFSQEPFSSFEEGIAVAGTPRVQNSEEQEAFEDNIRVVNNSRQRGMAAETDSDRERSSIYYEENKAKSNLRRQGFGVQMPGATPGFGTVLKGGVVGMLARGFGEAVSLFKGDLAENIIMPDLNHPNYDAILNEMVTTRWNINGFRLDKTTVENLALLQNMGYDTAYHISKDGVITPTSKYTVGKEKGTWDKIPAADWTFWGGSGKSGVGDTGLPDATFWDDAYSADMYGMGSYGTPTQTYEPKGFTDTSRFRGTSTTPVQPAISGGAPRTTTAATTSEGGDQSVVAPYDPGGGWTETVSGGGEFGGTMDTAPSYESGDWHMYESGGSVGMQEGGMAPPMPMPPQEGMEAPMPMPQEGAAADMANLGMINEQAAPPQEGGQASVEDDVPREADEGDYILPYETVLLVGLKQLNRYAREAIKLAMKNDIDLGGTDLDPTDDVPIKVSNYEFHIPKILVPFFGGGKKYLDKIRDEGLALRKRLEEEKQPSAQEQQQPQPTAEPAPPQLEAAPAAPPQAGPPMQPPMMQKGGFVLNPNEEQQPTPTTAAVLEGDTSQQATAYNQLKALQRSQKTQQQPPMVDPTGKVIPQGFAAPQGYQDGTSEGGVQKGEVRKIFSYDFNIIEDEEFKGESGTNVDFLHPDEPQNSSGMPTIIIKDRAKLEEQVGDIDNFLKGEALHYLSSVDPKYSGLRDSYKKSLTSGQKAMDKSAFERAKQQGESRPFNKWMETHRLDAHIRGALYQDTKDEWAGTYTPEQNQILDTIKNHLSNLETGPVEQPLQPELVEPVTDVLSPPQEDILPLPEEKEEATVPALPVEEAGIPTLPAERQPGFAQQPMIA